jgi:hypothetical protein
MVSSGSSPEVDRTGTRAGTAQAVWRSSQSERRAAMRVINLCCLLAAGAAGIGTLGAANAALPAAHPGPTVNDYTAAESGRAEAAARAAGFSDLEITTVQAGNFFFKAAKAGQACFLTVTPEGKVYSSAPAPAG